MQKEIAKALFAVQKSLDPVKKNAKNPHLKSKYADLTQVWDAIRGPLCDNELLVTHTPMTEPENFVILTDITHVPSGQSISAKYPIKPHKDGPQAVGSAITYAKRYSLCALLGIVTEDDDGEGAQRRRERAQEPQAKGIGAEKWETIEVAKTVLLDSIKVNGEDLTVYGIFSKTGKLYQTTKKDIAEEARFCRESGEKIRVLSKPTENGHGIIKVEAVAAEARK